MKKFNSYKIFLISFAFIFTGCSNPTPEKYFNVAVLNSNFIVGFANDGLSRELESPSVKMAENSSEPVPMKRIEIIDTKIQFIDEQYENVKSLKITDDSKDIMDASLALYSFVLPVYKTEYIQLANLYDNNAGKDQIETLTKLIQDKYFPRFEELYKKLIAAGKVYAAKHNIKVNWGSD